MESKPSFNYSIKYFQQEIGKSKDRRFEHIYQGFSIFCSIDGELDVSDSSLSLKKYAGS